MVAPSNAAARDNAVCGPRAWGQARSRRHMETASGMPRYLGRVLAGIVLAMALSPSAAMGCTFFALRGQRGVWVGNNEDFNYPRSKVWFQVAEPGRHGRVVFGFESGEALGGMNDQGLVFDWVAKRRTGWLPDPAKPPTPGQLGEKALESASTVEEAIALFQTYNEPQLGFSQAVLADRTGNAAVVGWEDGRLQVTRIRGKHLLYGFGEEPARPLLDAVQAPSTATLAPVLRAALQAGEFATKYSNLYDLEHLKVYWYDFHRSAGPFVFDLTAELAKGNHLFELLELPGQLDRPFKIDPRTLPRIASPGSALSSYTGRYRAGDTIHDVLLAGGRLYFESSVDYARRFELVPVATDRFTMRHMSADLRFERDHAGGVAALIVRFVGIGSAAHPVPNPQTEFRLLRTGGLAKGRPGLFDLSRVILLERPAMRVATIRTVLPSPADQAAMWSELHRTLDEVHVASAAPGYTVYHGSSDQGVDLEIVQPVLEQSADSGRVKYEMALPARLASVTHRGPHSTLPMAYGALHAWMGERGYAASGPSRETYLRGGWNEQDPRDWETVVEIPVSGPRK